MKDLEEILDEKNKINKYEILVIELLKKWNKDYKILLKQLLKKYKLQNHKESILETYTVLKSQNKIKENKEFEKCFTKKLVRTLSGVNPITIVMKPSKFSCTEKCIFCPDERRENGAEVDMPKSYLSNEPAVARASQNKFITKKQVWARLDMLRKNGHSGDKLEFIILGGTFSYYPIEYQKEFIRDIYYASNIFNELEFYYENNEIFIKNNINIRNAYELEKEQLINESNNNHVIGICIETRPDCIVNIMKKKTKINNNEIKRLRTYGVTRVQIGVQHTDNNVLKYVKRGHTVETSIEAIKILKSNGFKVDIHIMPDLPSSSYEKDIIMADNIFKTNLFKPDYLKIYPCLDTDFTVMRELKTNGIWKPYSEEDNANKLIDLICYMKSLVPKYLRINRVQRDFSTSKENCIGYKSETIKTNLRQLILNKLKKNGLYCNCIRCNEIKDDIYEKNKTNLYVEKYNGNEGLEYFISIEKETMNYYKRFIYKILYKITNKKIYLEYKIPNKIYGFARLRINDNNNNTCFDSLYNCGLIRELHVYGLVNKVNSTDNKIQHKGFGKILMKKAEDICIENNITQLAVISGVGVRNYYRKLGYYYKDTYMIKDLDKKKINIYNIIKYFIYFTLYYICYNIFLIYYDKIEFYIQILDH